MITYNCTKKIEKYIDIHEQRENKTFNEIKEGKLKAD